MAHPHEPPFGALELNCLNPHIHVYCRIGMERPTLTDGVGGWEVIARPRRVAITQWTGRVPWRMRLPVLLDGFIASNTEVESKIQDIIKMGRPVGYYEPPPVIFIDGAVPLSAVGWVIESIEWGTAERELAPPHDRIRQEMTLLLLQHIPREWEGEKDEHGHHPKFRMITTKKGDTCNKVSRRYFKTAKYGRQIAKDNNLRDPSKVLRTGRKLRIRRRQSA